ncbi:MAG: glycosyltransferase family 4 protein [Sporichthyaceae bacterium]
MRVAFVTQWFPPEPSHVAGGIADGLAARGHDVDVLTGFPNYPHGVLYDGYPLQRYRVDRRSARVTVHRSPLYASHDANPARRMANYLSWAGSATYTGRARLPKPDVWLTYYGPATAVLPAVLSGRTHRAPVCHLIQDLWPDSVTDSGFVVGRPAQAMHRGLETFCDWTYRRAAGIGVISPSMRQVLLDRGVPAHRIHYTPNWIDDAHLHPGRPGDDALRTSLGLPVGRRLFVYAGSMGEVQGLAPVLEAFAHVPQTSLVLVGSGTERDALRRRAAELRADNVEFRDPVPAGEIGRYLAAADVLLVSLKDTALLRATMPSKVQAALAAGRPILAHASGDVAHLIDTTGAGIAVRPGDVGTAVLAIRALAAMPSEELARLGHVARACFEERFSAEIGLDRLEHMLATCVGRRPAAVR